MKKKKHTGTGWMTLCVLAFLGLFFIVNIGLAKKTVLSLAAGELSFSEFTEELQDAYTSDEFSLKTVFININGLFARVMGQRVCNDVVLMKNGMLTLAESKRDMKKQAEAIVELAEFSEQMGSSFLYVQAPYKEDMQDELLPVGVESYANENTEELLFMLREKQIETLDLRSDLSAKEELINQYYYKTDHHWNYTGAFVAFQKICARISERFPEKAKDLAYTDLSQWESHTLENWFLGSRGKRVGSWFAGTDDFTWYTPMFATSMSCAIPKNRQLYQGDFSEAVIRQQYAENKDYFGTTPYVLYIGGDYPLVQHRNHLPVSDLKVLMIKDSYVLPVQAYLSTIFSEVDVIDPRHYKEGSIAEYIVETNPDVVLVLINPSSLGTKHYLDFGVNNVIQQKEQEEQFVWKQDIVVEPSLTNNYHYKGVSVEYNKTYRLSIEDVEFLQGEAAGVVVSLYNKTTKTILSSAVFDVEYCRKKSGFEWMVSTPEKGTDELLLLFYAGLPGNTKEVSVKYKNVELCFQ